MNKNEISDLIQRLKNFNEWRRCNDFPSTKEMPNPRQVGEDIDEAIRILETINDNT